MTFVAPFDMPYTMAVLAVYRRYIFRVICDRHLDHFNDVWDSFDPGFPIYNFQNMSHYFSELNYQDYPLTEEELDILRANNQDLHDWNGPAFYDGPQEPPFWALRYPFPQPPQIYQAPQVSRINQAHQANQIQINQLPQANIINNNESDDDDEDEDEQINLFQINRRVARKNQLRLGPNQFRPRERLDSFDLVVPENEEDEKKRQEENKEKMKNLINNNNKIVEKIEKEKDDEDEEVEED